MKTIAKFFFPFLTVVFLTGSLVFFNQTRGLQKANKTLEEESIGLKESLAKLSEEKAELERTAGEKISLLEGEKEKLRSSSETLRKENESLKFNLGKTQEHLKLVNEEKTYLEEILITKSKEIELLKGAAPDGSPQGGTSFTASLSFPEETPRTLPKKQGKVAALDEDRGFIIVDLGKVDGVKEDSVLSVLQGDETIARLAVVEIRDVLSAWKPNDVKPGKKIAVNDPVLLKKQ
ncbi:MAG: hypothetical protein HY593_02000 [Candidatus Omnitrophica bacterium]|nr:hypothetical protein [Candidatus Omnitrophota bacterium]